MHIITPTLQFNYIKLPKKKIDYLTPILSNSIFSLSAIVTINSELVGLVLSTSTLLFYFLIVFDPIFFYHSCAFPIYMR